MTDTTCAMKCWSCRLGQCPGGAHPWADDEDREAAAAQGKEVPSGRCGCSCTADEPYEMEPDGPDLDAAVLNAGPCTVCGEADACGYDSEGRALIHAKGWDDDAD